jgi:hypothetical protein
MNMGRWNMDSGFAAQAHARVRAPVELRILDAQGAPDDTAKMAATSLYPDFSVMSS